MDKAIAVDRVGTKVRQARKTDTIGIAERRHRDALQHVVLQVLAVTERAIIVTAAIAGRAAADAAGNLLPRTAQRHVDAQVDATIARITAAETARTIKQRQPPVGVAAEQHGALCPAQVGAHAFDVALAVRHPRVERTFTADPVIERQR
ncbi:hypothetical protein D3C71_1210870 [compost metagenome]